MNTYQSVADTLQSSDQPDQIVLERLYQNAFELSDQYDPFAEPRYTRLDNLEPTMIGSVYKGDAVEFINATLNKPYQRLRDLVKRLADSIQAQPFAGESITSFIERVVSAATEEMLKSNV